MKNLFLRTKCLFALLCCISMMASAQQSLNITFNNDDYLNWSTENSSSYEIVNGHLNCIMGEQSNGKYRGDFKFNNANNVDINFTLYPAQDVYIALKFINTRPSGALKFEFNDGSQWFNSKWNGGNPSFIETSSGNKIYYFKLSDDDKYNGDEVNVRRMNFIIADASEEPYSYTLDWLATFSSLEELEAYKNYKDDGEADEDDEEEVIIWDFYNQTSGQGYSSLTEALEAAANHDVIELNVDIEVSSRINIEKPVTLIAKEEGIVISRSFDYSNGLVLLTRSGGDLILGGNGGLIVLDGNDIISSSNFIEASNGATTTLMNNVIMRNCVSTSLYGAAICNKSNGKLILDGVTFESCKTVDSDFMPISDRGVVFVGTGVELRGHNAFINCEGVDIYIEGNRQVEAIDANHIDALTFFIQDPASRTTSEVILNYTDVEKMLLMNEGYSFISDGTHLQFTSGGTGLSHNNFIQQFTIETIQSGVIITSSVSQKINMYRADGVKVLEIQLVEGLNRIENLQRGFYIINGSKFFIK